jgi:hypothetical protein
MHIPGQQFSQRPCQLNYWLMCPQCPECGIDSAPHSVPPQAGFQGCPSHLGPRPPCSYFGWRTQLTHNPLSALCDGPMLQTLFDVPFYLHHPIYMSMGTYGSFKHHAFFFLRILAHVQVPLQVTEEISFVRIKKSPFSQWRRNNKVNTSSKTHKKNQTRGDKKTNTHQYEQKCQSHTCSGTINNSMYDSDLTITTSPLTSSAPYNG